MSKKECPTEADAVIIGNGPAGLALGVLLSRTGRRVVVVEKRKAGGGLHTFTGGDGRFEFETGFHYSGELGNGEELRGIVDGLTGSSVDFARLDQCTVSPRTYDSVYFDQDDGTKNEGVAPFFVKSGTWREDLKKRFPHDISGLERYFRDMETFGAMFIPLMVWRSLPVDGIWGRVRRWIEPFCRTPTDRFMTMTADKGLDGITSNKELRALLSYLSLGCCGVLPNKISYSMILALHNHFERGGFYPVGGPNEIAARMVEEIEKCGGRVFAKAEVDRILLQGDVDEGNTHTRGDDAGITVPHAGNRVIGVRLKKGDIVIKTPMVVSACGLHVTAEQLLPSLIETKKEKLLQHVHSLTRTKGHMFLMLGIDGDADDLSLPRGNRWLLPSTNLVQSMDEFHSDASNPFGYIGIAFSSVKNPGCVDATTERLIARAKRSGNNLSQTEARALAERSQTCVALGGDIPYEWFCREEEWAATPAGKRGMSYEAYKNSLKEKLLAKVLFQFPQIEGKIVHVACGTPLTTNHYLGKTQGESYGLELTPAKHEAEKTWLRPQNKDLFPEGLYITGQDLSSDGMAPSMFTAILTYASIDGPLSAWSSVIRMIGVWTLVRNAVFGKPALH